MNIRPLIEWAKRFQGFLGFAAFILAVFLVGATYLFGPGSFAPVLVNFNKLTGGQFLTIAYLALGLPFIIILLLIGLGYKSTTRLSQGGQEEDIVRVQVYDSATKQRLSSAEVKWTYRGTKNKTTDVNGEAEFTFPATFRGKTCKIEASREGYQSKSTQVVLGKKPDIPLYLPAKDKSPSPNLKQTVSQKGNDADSDASKGSHNDSYNTTLKFFYYISIDKVKMLLKQIQPELTLSENEEVIPNTLSLIEELEKNQAVKPMSATSLLDTSFFISDKSTWHNGLFSFNTWGHAPIVTYLLWRTCGTCIVLLVGSPNNILGQKVVEKGIFVPGTSGAFQEVLDFVSKSIKTDEPRAVTLGPIDTYGGSISDLPEPAKGGIKSSTGILLDEDAYPHGRRGGRLSTNTTAPEAPEVFGLWNPEAKPISLGIFCLKYLQHLPETQIDTIFKIYNKFELSFDALGASKMRYYDNANGRSGDAVEVAKSLHLDQYNTIYIGSPIYTAIV